MAAFASALAAPATAPVIELIPEAAPAPALRPALYSRPRKLAKAPATELTALRARLIICDIPEEKALFICETPPLTDEADRFIPFDTAVEIWFIPLCVRLVICDIPEVTAALLWVIVWRMLVAIRLMLL